MKRLIILTNNFPYDGGEQFIESEIFYWKNSNFDEVLILPNRYKGQIRGIPPNISIVGKPSSKMRKLFFIFLAFFSPVFFKEILYIIKNEPSFFYKKLFIALKTTANTLLQKSRLNSILKKREGNNYVYSYWNDVTCYGACLLKRTGKIKKVFSRTHGFDLYEERREYSYMPLKRQFQQNIDKIFCLSQSAVSYYERKYSYLNTQLDIARLGVILPNNVPNYIQKDRCIRVLSLSYCSKVKRIDKIIDSLSSFAKQYSSISIEWTHIGNGELYANLKTKAQLIEKNQYNFKASLVGHKSNSEVLSILQKTDFDIFINTSESEGIPVSIMEAMSYGIPAIAPNVGGIADLVNSTNGFLLSENAELEEITNALSRFLLMSDRTSLKVNARNWVSEYFNASANYQKFVSHIELLSNE